MQQNQNIYWKTADYMKSVSTKWYNMHYKMHGNNPYKIKFLL